MKGPGIRIDLDVRRTWRCPKCGRTAKYLGDVVALRCNCGSEPVWMQLTDLQRKPRAIQHAVVHPAAADEAADAADERQKVVVPESSAPAPAAIAENSACEPTAPTTEATIAPQETPAEPVVVITQVEEITLSVTTVTETSPTPDPVVVAPPPAPLATPPEDDFGAGLID